MTTNFDLAFDYVVGNEGGFSNDPGDKGGRTKYGITDAEAKKAGYDVAALTLDQAKAIYRKNYWLFEGVRDSRLATKLFDMAVNVGVVGCAKLTQRACGIAEDGKYGPQTEAAITKLPVDDAIERLSSALGDYYVDIARNDAVRIMRMCAVPERYLKEMQLNFLKGWVRRAVRRPPFTIKGV